MTFIIIFFAVSALLLFQTTAHASELAAAFSGATAEVLDNCHSLSGTGDAAHSTWVEMLSGVLSGAWQTTLEMAPYLLFGLLVAGILSVLITPETVERHLGSRGIISIMKASLFGIPLPLCSCGVIPVAASLRRHGASRGAVVSFLISTPQTGVDSIFVTYSLLGTVFAVFRPLAAFISGILGGFISDLSDETSEEWNSSDSCQGGCCSKNSSASDAASTASIDSSDYHDCHCESCDSEHGTGFMASLREVFAYGFGTVAADIAKPLLFGIFMAGAIGALVPQGLLESLLGKGIGSKIAMMLLGIPIYVCATASVPIAAALMLKGVSPGAALVFLMTGPATNVAALTTIFKILGRGPAFAYLGSVMVAAILSGVALDALIPHFPGLSGVSRGTMMPGWLHFVSAVLLLLVLVKHVSASFFNDSITDGAVQSDQAASATQTTDVASMVSNDTTTGTEKTETEHIRLMQFSVTGMSCSHCANAVKRNLMEIGGVTKADVELQNGLVTLELQEPFPDPDTIIACIVELGYEARLN
ncbi:MAG: hypothetical protein CVV64_11580 [Candidatus Wallbacteria bacterium HGW-Wallbacteria-1]|jgi:hypothetical protein|uniref:HMA domain-containing protein n=1 Tax=Candidatus Wallbacteria bacterium HGW-Wallbacteria-1 TaxID=2013854 RepID=A0A2N1PNP6_9BACT|nr:MAG: hypothetical protein CVV64_11580 [Candidatus Wallbacteria bacterium HGW-Wallbacteria-1]